MDKRKYMILQSPAYQGAFMKGPFRRPIRKFAHGSYNSKLVISILKYNGFVPAIAGEYHIAWSTPAEADKAAPKCPLQKLNHFPKSKKIIGNKAKLATIFNNSKEYSHLNPFFPKTYVLPTQRTDLYNKMREHPKEKFISKPPGGSCGHGIELVSLSQFYHIPEDSVVSQYISKPLCIDGFKFDLRIYVLVTSWAPLRAFIFKEGLARFATESYSINSLNKTSFLTNSSLNKKSEKYTQDFKWKLTELLAELEVRFKRQSSTIFAEIRRVVSESLAVIQPAMVPPTPIDSLDSPYFEIYGFDILFDRDWRAYLLEINTFPSLCVDNDVDFEVKAPLVAQALSIAGIMDADYATLPSYLSQLIESNIKQTELEIINSEDERLVASGGDFERIFPSINTAYLNGMLKKPVYQVPNSKLLKSPPIPTVSSITESEATDLLVSYLLAKSEEMANACASRETKTRISMFLTAQGYHPERFGNLRIPLSKYVQRAASSCGARRMDSELIKNCITKGDEFVGSLLKGAKMKQIKHIEALFP